MAATLKPADTRAALDSVGTPAAKAVSQDAELTGLLTDILNGTLAASEGKLGAALGFADKYAALADFAGKSRQNQTVRAFATSSQILTQTLGLLKLGSNASPGMVLATVGAMFTKKVALAFGLVENDKQAKLVAATADFASAALTVGVAAAGLSNPVGWVLMAGALAQLGATTFKGYAAYTE
ncbi:hypothetical protein [Rubrivivax rivuli]|uniref:Uncharacterized protein n=1 Tax=Rubrivivax rivuli TaxID=1862385 RepID=A0A437RAE3_9BURK|nr:hypothetical protein [Rubrivivax rivuli]RVU43780.1 hypothetical protein EOE66_19095 [Rubrivivax rivuli]